MKEIKFLDLTNPLPEAAAAAMDVFESGWYVAGPRVAEFEADWAAYCGAAHCAACGSGGAAIVLALQALDVPPGARVVMPALTFAATGMAVLDAGAQPVYCDVDERGLMDIEDAAAAAKETRAWGIMPVHLYGQLVDMQAVMEIARDLKLRVIEDAAQAHGALNKVHGDAACFSFYPGKNLGAWGEAGAVVTNGPTIHEKAKMVSDYGVPPGRKYDHVMLGANLRMDEIQAAVLSAKLPYLDGWNAHRRHVAELYELAGIHSLARGGCWHLYPVRVDEPENVRGALKARGIATGRHYPNILPEMPPLFQPGNWPVAVDIARHHITLPMGPHLSDDDVDYVAQNFLEVTR